MIFLYRSRLCKVRFLLCVAHAWVVFIEKNPKVVVVQIQLRGRAEGKSGMKEQKSRVVEQSGRAEW